MDLLVLYKDNFPELFIRYKRQNIYKLISSISLDVPYSILIASSLHYRLTERSIIKIKIKDLTSEIIRQLKNRDKWWQAVKSETLILSCLGLIN